MDKEMKDRRGEKYREDGKDKHGGKGGGRGGGGKLLDDGKMNV